MEMRASQVIKGARGGGGADGEREGGKKEVRNIWEKGRARRDTFMGERCRISLGVWYDYECDGKRESEVDIEDKAQQKNQPLWLLFEKRCHKKGQGTFQLFAQKNSNFSQIQNDH